MTPRERVIHIARQRRAGEAEIPFVLDVARSTDDRRLLGVCLDCFRSVLEDSLSDVALDVVRFLGDLLRNDDYRRIRRRTLITVYWIGRAGHAVLPELLAAFRKPRQPSWIAPARSALTHIAWVSLAEGDADERAAALRAFEQLHSLGLYVLRLFQRSDDYSDRVRAEVDALAARMATRYPDE